jgi:hypothetical protein
VLAEQVEEADRVARAAAKAVAQAIPELEAALRDIGSAHRDGCAPADMRMGLQRSFPP